MYEAGEGITSGLLIGSESGEKIESERGRTMISLILWIAFGSLHHSVGVVPPPAHVITHPAR